MTEQDDTLAGDSLDALRGLAEGTPFTADELVDIYERLATATPDTTHEERMRLVASAVDGYTKAEEKKMEDVVARWAQHERFAPQRRTRSRKGSTPNKNKRKKR